MSDADRRELERRFRTSGNVEDESIWLRARVRAGELGEERLRLAAFCGHRANTDALDGEPLSPPGGLEEWVHGLEIWGREACVRAACAAGQHVLDTARSPRADLVDSTSKALKAARAWLECPCETHQRKAEALFRTPDYGPDGVFKLSDRIAKTVAVPGKEGWIANESFNALFEAGTWTAGEFESFMDPRLMAALDDVRNAAAFQLALWALGYSDPVRERVEAREREAADE